MTIRSNTFAGGTAGSTVTTGNSAGTSGDAFTAVSGLKYVSDGGVIIGQLDFSTASTAQGLARWAPPNLQTVTHQTFEVDFSALPQNGDFLLMQAHQGTAAGTDAGAAYSVYLQVDGKFKVSTTGGGTQTYDAWRSAAIAAGAKVRVEVHADIKSGGATGTIRVTVYDKASGTLLSDSTTLTGKTLAPAGNGFSNYRFGKNDGVSYQGLENLRRVKYADGTDAVDGPDGGATNAAPVANAGADQYVLEGTASVALSGSATDSDGTVTGYQWTCTEKPLGAADPTITNATSASASFATPAAGRYRFQLVATDNLGATSAAASTTVWVRPAPVSGTARPKPYSIAATGGAWTPTGAASLLAALADAVASTTADSGNNPSSAELVVVWCPMGLDPFTFVLNGLADGGAVSIKIDLYKEDGATLVYSDAAYALSGSDAPHTVQPDSAAYAAVNTLASRRALVMKIKATAA